MPCPLANRAIFEHLLSKSHTQKCLAQLPQAPVAPKKKYGGWKRGREEEGQQWGRGRDPVEALLQNLRASVGPHFIEV